MSLRYDTDILAIFQPATQYTVTVQSEDTNKGTVSGGGTCYQFGSVSIYAAPKSGYVFDGWYLNGVKISSSSATSYSPSASCTLIAKFKAQYTVILQSEDTNRGTVSGGGTCSPGDFVYVSALYKSGWAFDGWYLNGLKIFSSPSFNYYPSSSCTLIAKFIALAQYTVTVQSEDTNKGTVSGGGTCSAGGYVSVSASAKSGYTFDGWYLSGSKISSSASFNYYPTASCTLIAKFSTISPPSPVISGSNEVCGYGSFQLINPPSGTIYWTVSNTSLFYVEPSGNPTTVYVVGSGVSTATLSARTGSTSGTVVASMTILPCTLKVAVYPNPVQNIFYVDITPPTIYQGKNANQASSGALQISPASSTFDIRLYDVQGNLLRQQNTINRTTQFNVSGLLNGVYYLHVYDGVNNTPVTKKIIVER